ncbi:MAG: hypothetical protein K0Q59_2528, partial [Paenibacillus sp.]|nr:hypothetical protein [Paenibacillus sp.]
MSQRAAWIHPLVKAIILIGFAVYIAYLVRTDNLFIYISPRMELYVKLAALGMYAVGAHQIYTSIRAFAKKPDPCDCGHDHSHTQTPWKSVLVYGLFALPLALGFFMPDTTLGSALAAKRGMNINSAATLKPVAAS